MDIFSSYFLQVGIATDQWNVPRPLRFIIFFDIFGKENIPEQMETKFVFEIYHTGERRRYQDVAREASSPFCCSTSLHRKNGIQG